MLQNLSSTAVVIGALRVKNAEVVCFILLLSFILLIANFILFHFHLFIMGIEVSEGTFYGTILLNEFSISIFRAVWSRFSFIAMQIDIDFHL